MRILLVLGGEPPLPVLLEREFRLSDQVIAVDGGVQPLFEAGLAADLLIGDFDSIEKPSNYYNCLKVKHLPSQDQSDFQKALDQIPLGADAITILGGTGKRQDHFINNLLIAMNIDLKKRVCFLDAYCCIHRITPERPLRLNGVANNQISLLPFTTAKGVQTQGLRWNLQFQNMNPQEQLGISNIAQSDEIKISLTEGCLWVIENDPKY